jgi:hypothetical protein
MADPLDPEQTQEETLPATEPTQATPPVQAQQDTSLNQFLYGDKQPQQPQQTQQDLNAFLYGTPEEKNAINSRLAVAQQVIDVANDPMATDLFTSIGRKLTEPGKSEAAWRDYEKNLVNFDPAPYEKFKEAQDKGDWKTMASTGLQIIGKDWGDYIAGALGMTNEEREKTQQSYGARMIVGKITDPKEAAEAMVLTDKYKEDLKAGKSIAPEGQPSAMSFGSGQLSLKVGMNLTQADEYLKTLQDTKTQAFGQGALRNFAIQSGDAFIPFVSVGDIIIDEKNKDQVARRAALAEAINQTISKDYFYSTVSGQALGSLGSFMAAGAGTTLWLGESANMAGKVIKVPTKLSQGVMYGLMGTSQSVKTDERDLSPMERLASIASESFILGLSERGGDVLGDQLDDSVAHLLKNAAISKSVPEFAPVVGGVTKALSIMVGESASDQLDAAMRGRNPFEDLALSYGTNFGIGAGLALAGMPRSFQRARAMAKADDELAKDFVKGLSAIRNDTNKTEEQKLAEVQTIKLAFRNNERINTLVDRAWALSAVDENTAPETHKVLKEGVDEAKRGAVENILNEGLNKQNEQNNTQELGKQTGELLPGVPLPGDQEQAELEKMKSYFEAGNKEIRIENTIENAEKIKWLESKGYIYGNLVENGSAYVVKGVRMGEGDFAKWYGEDDPRERFQGEKDELDKAITKKHEGTRQELDAKVEEIQNAATYEDLRRIGNKYLGVPLTERILEGKLIETQDRVAEELAINARLKVLNSNLEAIKKQRDQSPEDEHAELDATIAKFEQEIEKLTTGKQSEGEGNVVRIVKNMEEEVDKEIDSGKIAPEVLANPEVIIAILNPKNASFREHQLSEPSPLEEDKTKLGEVFDLKNPRVVENLQRIGALDDQGRPLMTPVGAIVAYALEKRNYLTSRSLSGYQSYGIADQVYNATVNKALLELRKGNKIALSTIFNSNLIDFIRKAKVRMRSGVGLGAMAPIKEQINKADPEKLIENLGLDENQAQLVKDTFDEVSATDAEWQAAQPGAVATPTIAERVEAMAIIASKIAPLFRQSLKTDLERLAFDSLLDSKVMAKLDPLSKQLGSSLQEVKDIQQAIQKQLVEQIKAEYRALLVADNLPSLPTPEGEVRKAGNLTNEQLKPTENFFARAEAETLMTDEELADFKEKMAVVRSGRRVEDLRNFQQELIDLIDEKLGIENGTFNADVLNDWVEHLAGVEGNPEMPGQLKISLAKGTITQAEYDNLLKQLNASMDKAVNLISNAKDIKDIRAAAREARASFVTINNAILPKELRPNAKQTTDKQTGASTTSGSDKTKLVAKDKQKTAKPAEGKQPSKSGTTKGSTSVAGGVSRVLQRIGAAILPKSFSTPKGQGIIPYSEDVITSLGAKFVDPANLSPEQRQDTSAAIASMEGSKNKSFYLANGAGTGKTRILLAVAQHYLNKGKKVLYLTAHDAVTPDWKSRTIGGTIQQDSELLGVPIVAYGGKASGLQELTSIPSGTVVVSTYNDKYMTKFLQMVDNDTVVIFDEHHSGRNIFQAEQEGNAETKWPVLMDKIAKKAGAVMMASGTPFDKPDQLLSLARLGIFDNISEEQLLFNLGFQKYEIANSHKYYWDLAPGVTLDEMQDRMEKYFDKLALNGVFRSRSLKLDGVNVEFKNVPLDPQIRATLDSIAERYGGYNSMASRMAAVVAQKRALETYKVKAAAQQAYDAIKRGVKPIVYVGFVSKEDSQGNKVDQVSQQVEAELKRIIAQDNPELASTLNVARLFSGGDGKQLAMDKFNNQNADVLIATVQMGGTGIELDDKAGNNPREMIIMSPPISAISAVQLIYRVWRADTASRPNIVFLTAEHQVDQEPLEKMRQRMRLLDATMGAGFQALKGEKQQKKEEIQIPVKGSPENTKLVNDKMTSVFKTDFKGGTVTIKDPSGKAVMTYKFNLYSGFDGPARADFGEVDEEDTITLNPDRMAAAARVLGDKFDAWLQAVVLEEALHLETVRMWRSQGKNISAELKKVAKGMSDKTRNARARLYYATQGFDLNKPDVKAKIQALAANDEQIAFEALRQEAQLALYGVVSEQLAVVTEADIARVKALAHEALRSEMDDEDKTMFNTILSYLNNLISVLKRGLGVPQATARLSMRGALEQAVTRLNKTKSEYTELADTTQPEAAPFQGSPAQPISLGVFGSYDLRVNKLIEDHLDNAADNVFGLKAANDSGRTVDKQDWLFALEQAYKKGTITKFERNMYRAAGLDSAVNDRVSLPKVLIKALEIGEAMETGTLEGSKSAVAIPSEALTPFPTVENAPVTDSTIQGKELYRFTLRSYPPQKTQADSIDQGLSQGVAKLLSTREKVVYEGQEYTWRNRGALVRELQRRGVKNYVSKVIPSRPITPFASEVAIANSGSTAEPTKNGLEIRLGMDQDRMLTLLGHQMYNSRILSTAVKELVQNSFDAVRSAGFTNENPGKVDITFDQEKRQLTVTDNGIGMTPEIIQKAFFTIGGTHKEGSPQNTSGGLGLAKMAFILGSDDISITTVKDGVESTVKESNKEVRKGIIKVNTKKTTKPNGTSVTVTIPKTTIDANGETKEERFSIYQPFLKMPLLGPVVVTSTNMFGERETLNIGVNQKDYQFETAFKFDWGTINMYIDPKRVEYPSIYALSAGLFQFEVPTHQVFGYGDSAKPLPYNIVLDVRPSVRADNPAYPFNLQREDWRKTVSEDIQAMYGYLKKFAVQQSLLQAKEAMQGIEKLPVLDITQDIPEGELAKLADEKIRNRTVNETFEPKKVVAVDFSSAIHPLLEKIRLIYEDNKVVDDTRSKYVEKSFKPEREVEMPTMDVSGFDVNEPLYFNNTNYEPTDVDKAFFTEISNTLLYLMRDLGTKVAQIDPSEKFAQLADRTSTGWFGGVSLDKNYRGLNMIKPFQSIWFNPANLSHIALKSPAAAVAETLHIMLHEITHVDQRNEGAGFTSALATLDATIAAYDVDIDLVELKLKKIYEKYWNSVQNLSDGFNNFNTKNRAESFQSSAALGVERARAKGAAQGIPNVDVTGAVSIQGQGPGSNFGTQEADSGTGLGDILRGLSKSGALKFPQTPIAPQASGPRIVESQAMKNLLGTFGDNLPDVPFKQRLMEDLYNNSVTMEQQFEDARNYIEGQDSFAEAVRHYLSNSIDTPLPIQAAVGFELLRVLSPQAKTDPYAREVMTKVMLVQKQRYGTDPGRTVQLWAALSEMSDNPEAMKMYVHQDLANIAAGRLEPYKRDLDEARIGLQEAGRKAADRVATDPTLKSTLDKITQIIEKNRKEQNFEGIDKEMYGFVISDEAQALGDAFLGPIATKPQASDVPGFDADEIRLAPERVKNLGTLLAKIIDSSDNPDALQADTEKLRALLYSTRALRDNPNQAEVRRLVELYFNAAFSYSKALREAASKGVSIAPVPSVTKGESDQRAQQDKLDAEDAAPIIVNTDFGEQLLMYADAAATAFERKSKKLQEEPKKKEFMEEFAKMIRMDLDRLIREKGGLKPKFEKPVRPTPAQNLRLAVQNIEEVRMYIDEIRDILLERYKGKESELVGLEPLIEDALDHPLSVSAVAKTIKSLQSIGGPKVNVRELIRSSRGDIEAFENKLSNLLLENSNLDAAQIKVVNDYLRDAMSKFLEQERKKELERIKKRIEEKRGGKKAKRQVSSALTKMMEAGNLGVFKDQDLFDNMRLQLGLPEMTAEQLVHLDKMIEDLPNYPKGRVRNQKISKMYEYVKLLSPMTVTELLVNYQTMNLLLGIGTIGINASSSFANNIAQSAIIAARGATKVVTGTIFNKPAETIRGIGYLKAAIETYKPFTSWKKGIGLQAAKEIFLKGDFSSVQSVTTMEMGGVNMFEAFSNQLDSYLKKSSGAMKPEITIKTPGWLEWIGLNPEYTFSLANKYAWSKFNPATVGPFIIFGRAMAAGDAMNTIAAKRMYQTAEAYNVALKKGLTSRIEVEEEVARLLNSTPEARARAEAIATAESKEFNYTPYQYILRVEEIIEQNRPQDEISQDLMKRTEKFAERSNFRNNFEGVLGAAAASAVTLSNVFPPSKFVLKYLKTGAALGNAALDVVPVLGTLRYYQGIGNFERMRDSKFFSPPPQKDTVEQDIALGKMWLSYILGAGLIALLRKALDRDPDPDFNIHISGPKDPAQRKSLIAAGWKARSIQIGSFANGNPRFISFEALPPFLAGMLIPLGAAVEAIRYEKRSKQEAIIPTIAAASWMTIYAMLDYSFLSGIRGLIQLAAPSNGATSSIGQLENIIKFTGNVASTLIPGYAILRDVEKMVEGIYGLPTGRLYQDSFMSVFLASVPFASKVGEPSLDFLGGTTRAKFWNSVPFVRRIMTTGADTSEYAQGIRTEDAIHDKLISLFAKNQTCLDWEAGPLKVFAAAELATKPTVGISEILTLKRELTENEKYAWMKRAYPYIIESLGGNIETLESLSPEEFKYVVGQLARPFMKLALYEVLGEENQDGIINELSPEATNVLPTESK